MRLSVHLMVLNGAGVVGRMIRSVRGVADEICFVDTGSTDGTPEVVAREAAAAGLRCSGVEISPSSRPDLYFVDEPGAYLAPVGPLTGKWILRDWAAARNLALDLCRGDYVLKLDADDELLTPGNVLSVLDGLDECRRVDFLLCPYEVMDPATRETHHVEMYTRLWRNRPEIRFREVCHENVDWCRRADGSNWIMLGNPMLARDHRDSRGDGTRVPHRNLKVLLREHDRLMAASERPTAHLVMYLAAEASELLPTLALEILDRWTSRLRLFPQDEAWRAHTRGECHEALDAVDAALREYAHAAELGFHRSALRRALLLARVGGDGWREALSVACRRNQGHYYPQGAFLAEIARAEALLGRRD